MRNLINAFWVLVLMLTQALIYKGAEHGADLDVHEVYAVEQIEARISK